MGGDEPSEMALTLPLIWITQFLTLKTLTIWLISVSAIKISRLFSWFSYQLPSRQYSSRGRDGRERTMFHLLPSSSVLAGFLTND